MAPKPKPKTTPDERAAQEYCKYFEQRSRGSRRFEREDRRPDGYFLAGSCTKLAVLTRHFDAITFA
jgi:hypothetical protein